jgi:2-methylisocitrate lyase-like PEP mutase family enzyme
MTGSQKIEAFHALHHSSRLLKLPNAWDEGSAKILARAGFPAVATTSAGIAFSHGLSDGELLVREVMLEAIQKIAASVQVPVSVDLETGFGETPEEVAETVRLAAAAGAVGINLEDAMDGNLVDLPLQLERLVAAREAHPEIFLNARTDVFWLGIGAAETRFEAALERLLAYIGVGADGIFAPGAKDAATIKGLVQKLEKPLNVLGGALPTADLERLGVARVTLGSGMARAAYSVLQRSALEFLQDGTYSSLEGSLSYEELNDLFADQ